VADINDPGKRLLLRNQPGSVVRDFVERPPHAAEAAEALKLTARDLLKLEVVDQIILNRTGARIGTMILLLQSWRSAAPVLQEISRFQGTNCWKNGIKNFAAGYLLRRQNRHCLGALLM